MRRACVILLTMVMLATACSVGGANELLLTPYQGVVIAKAPIRKEPSTQAKQIGDVRIGDLVDIHSIEGDWLYITREGVTGYLLGTNVEGIHNTESDHALAIPSESGFTPLYTCVSKANLSLREDPSREARQKATVYEGDSLLVAEIGEEWAFVRFGKQVGYVLSEYLDAVKVINPYWASLPGAHYYPYAARVLFPVEIIQVDTGEVLQTLSPGAVFNARIADQEGMLLLPYKRTWGYVPLANVELMDVVSVGEAGPGDLLGVFATYFPNDPQNEVDIGRLYNINEGVVRLDGLRIGAGERFSFNSVAAPYTKGNGYMKGPIINYVSDKKTGFGGGICQVSTTLYNLLLQLPMRIITTRPHSSVGIDYAPVNYDAAVGNGNLDLIFENMLPYDVELRLESSDGVITVMMRRAGGE